MRRRDSIFVKSKKIRKILDQRFAYVEGCETVIVPIYDTPTQIPFEIAIIKVRRR